MSTQILTFLAFMIFSGSAFADQASYSKLYQALPSDGQQVSIPDFTKVPDNCRQLVQQDFQNNTKAKSIEIKAWRISNEVFVSAQSQSIFKMTHIYSCQRRFAKPVFFSVLDKSGRTTAQAKLWHTEWDQLRNTLTSTF